MARHIAKTRIPLPARAIRKRYGMSEYIYVNSGPHDVDLDASALGQDEELRAWMTELLWSCQQWEVARPLPSGDPAMFAKDMMGRLKASEQRRERAANGYMELF